MKVLFLPYYDKGNPYQRLLATSLSKEGVDVRPGTIFRFLPLLRSLIINWKPDIVHLHWHHPFLISGNILKTLIKSVSFFGEICLLKLLRVKLVWTVHNIYNHEERFVPLELSTSRLLTKLCDRIIVHSQAAKYEVEKAYGLTGDPRVTIVPHGNYISVYQNNLDRSRAREQLKIEANDLMWLYFGMLRSYKGILELVDAFRKLDYPQAKLFIVGKPCDDEIIEKVQKACKDNPKIRLVPRFVPDDEIQVYMNAADAVVLPYRDILTSGAAILAISFGKPVIAPRKGCLPDILHDEGNILYDPLSQDGLLRAMRQSTSRDLAAMGKYNFEVARQLRWEQIAQQTRSLYQECLSK